jgi:uncharacterized Fe-S cluster-containing MiaB family protein
MLDCSRRQRAGTQRGCTIATDCDKLLLAALERFNFEQDVDLLEGHDCHCRSEWRSLMNAEGLMRTSVAVHRHLDDEAGSIEGGKWNTT